MLCDELKWQELGAVVHCDPRVEWSSQAAHVHARSHRPPIFRRQATENDWVKKKRRIELSRVPELQGLGARIDQAPDMEVLKKQFFKRTKEYMVEDYGYRRGHYAPYTILDGPRIRLKVRPNTDIVGDHDLFAFTHGGPQQYGVIAPAHTPNVPSVQTALQEANSFQAQHGGIWYWEPQQASHVGIGRVIMAGHSPNGDEPLVYFQPDGMVSAAYYLPEEDCLKSVGHNTVWTKWMKTTHSGKLLLASA